MFIVFDMTLMVTLLIVVFCVVVFAEDCHDVTYVYETVAFTKFDELFFIFSVRGSSGPERIQLRGGPDFDFIYEMSMKDNYWILKINGSNVINDPKRIEISNHAWTTFFLSWELENTMIAGYLDDWFLYGASDLSKYHIKYTQPQLPRAFNFLSLIPALHYLFYFNCHRIEDDNWRLLYHQQQEKFPSPFKPDDVIGRNYPLSQSFRNVTNMDLYREGIDASGSFTFELNWSYRSGTSSIDPRRVRWKQYSNPTITAFVTNFTSLSSTLKNGCNISGLYTNESGVADMTGAPTHGTIPFAVGSYQSSLIGACSEEEEVFLYVKFLPGRCVESCAENHWVDKSQQCINERYPCETCATCNSKLQFIEQSCTKTTNTICKNCAACSGDSYADGCIREGSICKSCGPKCNVSSFDINNCGQVGGILPRKCQPCGSCPENTYGVGACNWDYQCKDCGPACPDKAFETRKCGNMGPRICSRCTICSGDTPYTVEACNRYRDTKCSSIESSTTSNLKTSQRNTIIYLVIGASCVVCFVAVGVSVFLWSKRQRSKRIIVASDDINVAPICLNPVIDIAKHEDIYESVDRGKIAKHEDTYESVDRGVIYDELRLKSPPPPNKNTQDIIYATSSVANEYIQANEYIDVQPEEHYAPLKID